ncbi:efflux transporter outer membrane subunit [Thiomicrorhabdus xiamenensis]|uniref:Efflux transporter outer membrane subunit n=1 Tax=Thiomicrorhabdus xiamenensis TaxID=2739063 RepID=A0A7D4P4A4_9GAMM|nr:efflux transporter outer membrane subunit [Thiomicrorhabdus xiamenensis]QKI88715.1 efflux transporter outer membrane subunit [Thiomicrorhabdus xiamenensis]
MKLPLISGALAVCFLSACTAPQVREVPREKAPEQWQANKEESEVSRSFYQGESADVNERPPWWQTLQEPLLNRLIEEAIQANPDVLSAQSAIRQARAYRKQANATLFPTVTASGAYSASRNHDTNVTTDAYSTVIDASWEADVFGANRSALSAADSELSAAQADFADTLVSLSAEVANYYVSLRSTQAQLAITEESLSSWRETLQMTIWQAEAGQVSQFDVEQARRSYQQTIATLPPLRQSILESQHQLAVLLGRQPGELPTALNDISDLPTIPDSIFLPLPSEVLRQRPDVRAAEQRVLAAMAQTDVAKANLLPSFALGGRLGWGASNLSDLFNIGSLVSSLSASVAQTLFDGELRQGQLDAQQEAEAQAVLQYRKTVLSALQETENALANLQHSRETFLALESALQISQEEEKLALIQYQAGELDFSDVMEAQRTRLSLRKQSVEARASELAQVITLSKAVAGHWAMQQATEAGDNKNITENNAAPVDKTAEVEEVSHAK